MGIITPNLPHFHEEIPEKKLVNIKYIGIQFDPEKCSIGESELNHYLNEGYDVIRDYQTSTGIVVAVGLFKNDGDKNG